MASEQASQSFVFKLKYSSPSKKEETRRYGFSGDLRQEAVFEGLYERTSQVFSLPRSDFALFYNNSRGESRRLDSFQDYAEHVCDPTLNPDNFASCKRDEKKRIVLVFHIRGKESVTVDKEIEKEKVASAIESSTPVAEPAIDEAAPTIEVASSEELSKLEQSPFVPTSTLFTPAVPAESSAGASTTSQVPRQQYHPYYPTRPHPFNLWAAPPAPPQLPLSALQFAMPTPPPPPPAMPLSSVQASGPSASPSLIEVAPAVAARRENILRRCRVGRSLLGLEQSECCPRFPYASRRSRADVAADA